MSGTAALGRRRDTSAARAALARRRQRAAHALQPNNTSNAALPSNNNNNNSSLPPIPKKVTTKSSSPRRSNSAADPAGSSKYLSPNRPSNSLNAVARNRNLSPPGSRQRIPTERSTVTTASMTVDSSMTPPPPPPSIQRKANRTAMQLNTSMGSSPLKSTPARTPQKVIHYTTQTLVEEIQTQTTEAIYTTAGDTTSASAGGGGGGANMSKRIAPSRPIHTANTTPRTSSAALNARLKARYQSPLHAKSKPPTVPAAAANASQQQQQPLVQPNHRPPQPSVATAKKSRIMSKPPMALTKHVANKPPPTARSKDLTISTNTTTTTTNATNTSRAIAASPKRSAVRDRMTTNSSKDDHEEEEVMTPSAANTSKRMPTPTSIPVVTTAGPSGNSSHNNTKTNNSEPPQKTASRIMSPQRQEQMSQRLAQRAIDANRHKNIDENKQPRGSPPKEFASISTFLMNDVSILDTTTSNLLDTTLPPVETTPTNNGVPVVTKEEGEEDKALNQSVLLENVHLTTTATWSLDASCLQHHSEIMLRSCSTGKTIQREQDLQEQVIDDSQLNCRALGLGTTQEALCLDKVDPSSSPELRHGDYIRMVASGSSSHAMGAYRNERYGLTLLFLPIFAASQHQQQEQLREEEEDTVWQVFGAEPDKKLLVGRAAVESLKDENAASSNNNNNKLGAPIRAGVPIVLRHVTTGGVLSMSDQGSVQLLTDSFGQSDVILESMDQLQHHNKLLPNKQQTFQFLPLASPPCPTWAVAGDGETFSCIDERIFLTSSYLLHPKRRQAEFETQMQLSKQDRMEMTSKVKEKILMEEVIGSFLGLEGRHIRIKQGDISFHLSGTDGVHFEMSLHHLVEQILPMSTSYIRVQHFCTSHHPGYNHGRVMQAFCEGLDTLVQDYVDFVVQLECQHRSKTNNESSTSLLTMKNIFFQISPWLHSMSILEHATRAVRETKGGALINALWSLERQVYMGDMVAKKVLGILLEKASLPYLDMMAEWLESGRLNDPFQEFMVRRSSSEFDATQFDGDDWMAMFGIDEENILEGVTSDDWTKEKILTTGKYWNAVHACQVDVDAFLDGNAPKIPKLPFNSDSSAIVAYIDSMYQSASKVLVQLMKEKFMLTESMDIMKRYFLLDQGDFVMNFLDAAEDELSKKAREVSVGRVQNWLNASIQLTEQHRTKEDEEEKRPLVPQALRCRFSAKSLISFLESRYGSMSEKMPLTPSRNAYPESTSGSTGIEVFVIDFSYIPFPISLVLSHHAMDKYKLLFRHLLFTKHVERRLIRVWRDHQILKKLGALRGLLGPTFLLRQRMLHFVQNFLYYMSFEVIDNNWTEMMSSIDAAETKENRQQTVDDILQVHDAFLERTLEACLLTNRDLVKSLTKLLNTVLLFTKQMKRFMDATRIHDDSTILAAEKQLKVQRNLNERGITPGAAKRKTIRRELMSTKHEREALNDRQTRRVGREVISESYQRMVQRFGEVFNADVSDFMKELNRHTASGLVANLGVRLDYNGFVTASIR